ncbi:hypothetical protein [Agrobacterium rosae]|uniref:hypothetical protein n=1 Tax=Agrobacterium rosae TaxID=1972867 RepID=UPI002034649B|nr:hypothetical protein [Agrobacterium rosae]MCM2432079.1 hypothetical protein [Agrobacterium rosae]
MNSVQDYLSEMKNQRRKMVEQAAACSDFVANIKGIAQLQLAIIATEAVERERIAAQSFDLAIEEVNRVAAARESGLI